MAIHLRRHKQKRLKADWTMINFRSKGVYCVENAFLHSVFYMKKLNKVLMMEGH